MANTHIGGRFKSGDTVPDSGAYNATHDPEHRLKHEVTCIYGKKFPSCNGCKNPRFFLARSGHYIATHKFFCPPRSDKD
jgi:hypothetical protein